MAAKEPAIPSSSVQGNGFSGINEENFQIRVWQPEDDLPKTPAGDLRQKMSMESNSGGIRTSNDDDSDSDLGSLPAPTDDAILPKSTHLGFQQHVLALNPLLRKTNTYLVERISLQQVVRHKRLQNMKVRHHHQMRSAQSCPSGRRCISLGGASELSESRGSCTVPGDDDEDVQVGEIAQESFPLGIPMPPTTGLPDTLECQICYQVKAFAKPSDWTKHVIDDVQAYTCTWDSCKDPKVFKRKRDWIRHENEVHRHLEWWVCDVDDCRYICYRQNSFLQHLIREHSFPETKDPSNPKLRSEIQQNRASHPTWIMLEMCRLETGRQPCDEPCRFCGKTFLTWKKLLGHLAKHMEQIAFPLLEVIAREPIDMESVISPVHGPTPRTSDPEHQTHFGPGQMATPADSHFTPSSWHASPLYEHQYAAPTPISPSNPSPELQHYTSTKHFTSFSSTTGPYATRGTSARLARFLREGVPDCGNAVTSPSASVTPFTARDGPSSGETSQLPSATNQPHRELVQPASEIQNGISRLALQREPTDGEAMEVDPTEQPISRSQGSRTPTPSDMELTDGDDTNRSIIEESVSEPQKKMSLPLNRKFRQMGVAKIRVELLSISRVLEGCHESTDSDVSSEEEDVEPVEADGDQAGQSNHSNPGSSRDPPGARQSAFGGFSGSGNSQRNSESRERGGDGQGGSRKRRRQNSPESGNKRFACPYQVYEPPQDCLRRGPRNPKGGCHGVDRLKQHLRRRHMISFRCQTCWRSFDAKAKQREHAQTGTCPTKPKPEGERFMDLFHEAEAEKPCGSMAEEDVWWKLFQLLIPGMETWDLSLLKRQYYPYYLPCDNMSLTIPSLNFLNVEFPDQVLQFEESESAPNGFQPSSFAGVPSERPQIVSQTLSVPISWSEGQLPSEAWSQADLTHSQTSWVDLSVAAAPSSSDSPSASHLAPPVLNSISPSVTPSSAAGDLAMTQLRRNNERLKARVQRAEGEVTEFREASQAARGDIGLADAIVEDLLDSQGILSPSTYASLEKLSKLLETASGKLRRAV